ncbi:hypothetical protein R6Z07F_009860 [Ovis aries]
MPEEGRRVWQARGTGSREAEAAVAARSRRFPVPGKLRTAAAAAAAAAGSAHVSPPAPAPSSRLLSPPPPLALCSAFPRSRQSSPEPASAAPGAGPGCCRAPAPGCPCTRLGLDAGRSRGLGEALRMPSDAATAFGKDPRFIPWCLVCRRDFAQSFQEAPGGPRRWALGQLMKTGDREKSEDGLQWLRCWMCCLCVVHDRKMGP